MIEPIIEQQIAELAIPDVDRLSRHDVSAARRLADAIEQCTNRDDVKVIILRLDRNPVEAGQGDAGNGTVAERDQTYLSVTGIHQSICFANKVTILVVEGECAGAGALLALNCDFVVCAPTAAFHSPFASAPEANFVLAALIMRLNRAKSWMLGEHPLTAHEAHLAGLVNEIAEDPLAAARAMARSISRVPLDGLAMSKLMVGAVMDAQGVGQDFDLAVLNAQGQQFSQAWHD